MSVVLPAGRKLATLDADQLASLETIRSIPLPDSMQGFIPVAWSPSGDLLGGTEVDSSMQALSVGAFEPVTGTYRRSRLPVSGNGYWKFAGWLADSRHFVAVGFEQIALVDVETGAWRGLLAVDDPDQILSLSRDARTLLMETASADGDLRMLESQGAER